MESRIKFSGESKSRIVESSNEEPFDVNKCVRVSHEDVMLAYKTIRDDIIYTSQRHSLFFSQFLDMNVYIKCEQTQVTGSYKERGACNFIKQMSEEEKKRGVITASAGNHALAVSYHGKRQNTDVTVYMSKTAPLIKVKRCKDLGAKVVLFGETLADAKAEAIRVSKETGQIYVHGYDHPNIIAGQGTIAVEFLEQCPNLDAIVVAVGGGGMSSGVAVAAKAIKPSIKVIGVESELCPTMYTALKNGSPICIETNNNYTLADGLCVQQVGGNSFVTLQPLIDEMILVEEKDIALTILKLLEYEKRVIEGAGATGLAAAVSGKLDHYKKKNVGFVLGGGNIDATVLGRVIDRGLAVDSRLASFRVCVNDRPGGVNKLTELLFKHGASIKDILHQREWMFESIFTTELFVKIELRDRDHYEEVKKALEENYKSLVWEYDSKIAQIRKENR